MYYIRFVANLNFRLHPDWCILRGSHGFAKSHEIATAGGTDLAAVALSSELSAAGAPLHVPAAVSQLLADPVGSLAANPEWTRYAFMFPVGALVATCAQTAGIGGAAIMGPVFLLGFPLLGPAYPLHSVAASVATAIMCEAFGFSSGERGLDHPCKVLCMRVSLWLEWNLLLRPVGPFSTVPRNV